MARLQGTRQRSRREVYSIPSLYSRISISFATLVDQLVLTYLSAPHGIWVGLDGKYTPRSRLRTSCRSPCEHTSLPW
jgi:hypothetical protein